MKYEYSISEQVNTDGKPTKRPIVEVTIERNRQRRTFLALIDSGADQIIMPASIAEVFGIDRSSCPERSVIGVSMEPIVGFVGDLWLRIEHQREYFRAPVVFVDADVPVLLGRERFFDYHRVKFDQSRSTFDLIDLR
jgi:hypothetical protein